MSLDCSRTIVFAANRGYALKSSREAFVRRFLDDDWRVVLATADDMEARQLEELGAVVEPVAFHRGGLSPLADWRALRRLRVIFQRWRPSLVHLFHAKPIILGNVAARRALGNDVRVANTITGLGHAFIMGGVAGKLAGLGYRSALPRSDWTIFQNRDDLALFKERGWVDGDRASLIPGSGIDLDRFQFEDRSNRAGGNPVILMLGRLLRQKGIPEFIRVAQHVRGRWPGTRFLLAGEEDPDHPDAVPMGWFRQQDDVEYLGRLTDVRPVLKEADVFLFPTTYREGLPRVIMEAAATGLPTVAFDVPGVREAVRNDETGFLVEERDVDALAVRITDLLENANLRFEMGRKARELAVTTFDMQAIEAEYFDLYRRLGIAT